MAGVQHTPLWPLPVSELQLALAHKGRRGRAAYRAPRQAQAGTSAVVATITGMGMGAAESAGGPCKRRGCANSGASGGVQRGADGASLMRSRPMWGSLGPPLTPIKNSRSLIRLIQLTNGIISDNEQKVIADGDGGNAGAGASGTRVQAGVSADAAGVRAPGAGKLLRAEQRAPVRTRMATSGEAVLRLIAAGGPGAGAGAEPRAGCGSERVATTSASMQHAAGTNGVWSGVRIGMDAGHGSRICQLFQAYPAIAPDPAARTLTRAALRARVRPRKGAGVRRRTKWGAKRCGRMRAEVRGYQGGGVIF
ncbi:hypothetical protein GGX14DRAFT_406879 [Mycena pura]|uniref:Uncharacterized protein n=1 Tax=Mycena pura TaxID=153505 RepID=A0AAD6UPG6_9AGAR|nr:hypothetical protein GGX14DRAFT_406879 [Mycena pura]